MALSSGGVKDARRIPQPPPAVGHGAQLRGGRRSRRSPPPPIEEFDNNAGGSTGLAWPAAYPLLQVGPRHKAMHAQEFQIVVCIVKRPTILKRGASSQ